MCWSTRDRSPLLDLKTGELVVSFKGTVRSERDSAAIRTTLPVPAGAALFYYEIRVVEAGRERCACALSLV